MIEESRKCLFSGIVAKTVTKSSSTKPSDLTKLVKTGSKKGGKTKTLRQISNIRFEDLITSLKVNWYLVDGLVEDLGMEIY